MQEQTYARYALPGLLLVLVIGLLVILVLNGGSNANDDAGAKSPPTTTAPRTAHKSVTVRAGDSPSAIADRSGITLEQLLELNPRVDPRALHVGDRLKLVP